MKDEHLTLRLSRDLARTLARWARERGVPKSQLAREAVAKYLAPGNDAAVEPAPRVTAARLALRWGLLPRLTSAEATELGADLTSARATLPNPQAPWA